MPNRLIRDGILDSDRYWSVSMEARQMYFHMLLLADDYGCISVSPVFLRRRCFNDSPSHERIAKLLNELQDVDLIRLYDQDRSCYAFIPRFRQKLQRATLKHPCPPPNLLEGDDDARAKFDKQRKVEKGEDIFHFGGQWEALKQAVFARDGHKCVRCGSQENLHGHHIVPKSKGGESTEKNVTTLCEQCNVWARNNDERCLQIKQIVEKTASGKNMDSIPVDARHISEEKRREEKRREENLMPRGARLTADWSPEESVKFWASQKRPDLNIEETIEEFRDYWLAKPGKDGTKLDWNLTFKTWVRNARAKATVSATPQWWTSESATLAYGASKGMHPRPGEEMSQYRDRLRRVA